MAETHALLHARAEKADEYLRSKGFDPSQINGQRISIAKGIGTRPEQGSEVYAGKIPREIFEDQILPHFEQAGRIYKIRLMMDFSGTNRGFAYITYMTNKEAMDAVQMLNGIQLDENDLTKTVVVQSFDNKGLLFLGLPQSCSKAVLLKCLKEKVRDVVSIKLLPPKGQTRGAEVYFKSHEAACNARRLLVPGPIKILDCAVTIDWAKPLAKSTNEYSDTFQKSSVDQNNNLSLDITGAIQPPRPTLKLRSAHQCNEVMNHQSYRTTNNQFNGLLNYQSNGVANSDMMPISPDNILGVRGQAILQGCNDFDQRCLVVQNINLKRVADDKLTIIFELSGRLRVLSILRLNEEMAAIEYANADEPLFMLETLVLVPDCFSKLALPGRTLTAYLSSVANLQAYIPRGFSITHF